MTKTLATTPLAATHLAPDDDRSAPPLGGTETRTSRLRSTLRRRPLAAFFVLACLFSWWPVALGAAGWSSSSGLAGFGPFVAAIVVLALTEGRSGVKDLLTRMVRWRVAPRVYLAAIGLPVSIIGIAILLTLATGAAMPSAEAVGSWTQIPVMIIVMLVVPGVGGSWEEPGFRGFALGRLERRFGLTTAPLVLGAFWVVWHLPLFLTGDILWPDVFVIMAVSIVIAAVYHSGRESILVAMILHATNNALGGEFAHSLFAGADAVRLGLFVALGWVVAASVVLIFRRPRRS